MGLPARAVDRSLFAGSDPLCRRRAARAVVWTSAAVLLVFCVLGLWSIGAYYLPAAIALLVAARIEDIRVDNRVSN